MKLKSLILVATSIPTLAFAQNYQTQYLTGTYLDQAYQYNITSGRVDEDLARHQSQTPIDRLEEIHDHVANTQDRMTPNASPQNFNQSEPRMAK